MDQAERGAVGGEEDEDGKTLTGRDEEGWVRLGLGLHEDGPLLDKVSLRGPVLAPHLVAPDKQFHTCKGCPFLPHLPTTRRWPGSGTPP